MYPNEQEERHISVRNNVQLVTDETTDSAIQILRLDSHDATPHAHSTSISRSSQIHT